MKKLIAGNWKMNCTNTESIALAKAIKADNKNAEVLICPSFTALSVVKDVMGDNLALGAQDCHVTDKGAYTGNISADMLQDIDCHYVILGHSERREQHSEHDNMIGQKVYTALTHNLKPIVCVGEHLDKRESGMHIETVVTQLKSSIPLGVEANDVTVAYEPVWAIGTGRTASTEDILEMHEAIYAFLTERFGVAAENIRILYGGSVKAANAKEILSLDHVDGVLVGGASLNADEFNGIIDAA